MATIKTIGCRAQSTDPCIAILYGVFQQAVSDATSSRWSLYAPALSWLDSPEVRQLAWGLGVHLPPRQELMLWATRKRSAKCKPTRKARQQEAV